MADRTEDSISFLEFFRVVPNGQLFCIFSAESENAEGNQRSLVANVATRLDLCTDVETIEPRRTVQLSKDIDSISEKYMIYQKNQIR